LGPPVSGSNVTAGVYSKTPGVKRPRLSRFGGRACVVPPKSTAVDPPSPPAATPSPLPCRRIRRRDSRSSPLPTPKSAAAAADAVPHGARSADDPEILRPQELLPPPTRSSSRRPSSPAKVNSAPSLLVLLDELVLDVRFRVLGSIQYKFLDCPILVLFLLTFLFYPSIAQ
jgi:hypothetical protein